MVLNALKEDDSINLISNENLESFKKINNIDYNKFNINGYKIRNTSNGNRDINVDEICNQDNGIICYTSN